MSTSNEFPEDQTNTTHNSPEQETNGFRWIHEGSVRMKVPAEEEGSEGSNGPNNHSNTASSVFYNPVQVQNRDLSILMIVLHLERRATAEAVAKHKKTLLHQHCQKVDNNDNNGTTATPHNLDPNELQQALQEYKLSLNPTELLLQQSKDDNDRSGTGGGACILDALAASGLRSLRYWKEIPGIHHITINDLEAAIERANDNLRHNHLQDIVIHPRQNSADTSTSPPPLLPSEWTQQRGIHVHQGDAISLMYDTRESRPWNVIDLDPYGSAAMFLDSAIQSIQNHGLLCVTCTDMVALGGSHPETCFGRYHSIPIQRAGYLQEMALRILLYTMATTASKYGRTIQPILSVGMDFYVRVFVEVYDSKAQVHELSLQIGHVYQSTQCPSFQMVPSAILGGKSGKVYQAGRAPSTQCVETGASWKVGGPVWLGPLHDRTVVQQALKRLEGSSSTSSTSYPNLQYIATKDRLRGLLESCVEELDNVPLYYKLPDLCGTLHVPCIPLTKMKAALRNAGYNVSGYHKEPQAIKTNAPTHVVWDVLRVWCNDHLKKVPKEGSIASKILAIPPGTQADFTVSTSAVNTNDTTTANASTRSGVARFPMNPQPNWGPKPRAKGNKKRKITDDEVP